MVDRYNGNNLSTHIEGHTVNFSLFLRQLEIISQIYLKLFWYPINKIFSNSYNLALISQGQKYQPTQLLVQRVS